MFHALSFMLFRIDGMSFNGLKYFYVYFHCLLLDADHVELKTVLN